MNKKIKRTGVILAAGLGSRINDNDERIQIKPLLTLKGIELLMRTIYALEVAECNKIIIIVGWQAETIRKHISEKYNGSVDLNFVVNKDYHLKNGISVLCAVPYIDGEFILMMADHIIDDQIMKLARHHYPPKDGAILCVDYKIDTIFDMDDATKVYAEGDLIKYIGKDLKKYNCIDTGVFIATQGLMEEIAKVYKLKGDVSLTDGVQALAEKGLMKVLDIKTCFWQDVDNDAMLKHAEKLLLKKNEEKL